VQILKKDQTVKALSYVLQLVAVFQFFFSSLPRSLSSRTYWNM